MSTKYHSNLLVNGVWSPTRPSLFFLIRNDGWLDVWDYYYRQNDFALSHKVSDYSLTAIGINKVTGVTQVGSN